MSRKNSIWAPWRCEYVSRPREDGCLFCRIFEESNDRENLVLFRGDGCGVVMNRYPYNSGHLMVVPYRHVSELDALDETEMLEMMKITRRLIRVMKELMCPGGFNVGINMGAVAGAGIADHIHLHIVPRWQGDTNFLPVLADTRVVPHALLDMYDGLKKKLESWKVEELES
ncbi:MAG: HIT domain-containing protein [Acidobacteriota bacterium]|jgi:ATP adenylyltransferase|nr:HIT domain-containing protein [Acidobacteriota bacterium]